MESGGARFTGLHSGSRDSQGKNKAIGQKSRATSQGSKKNKEVASLREIRETLVSRGASHLLEYEGSLLVAYQLLGRYPWSPI